MGESIVVQRIADQDIGLINSGFEEKQVFQHIVTADEPYIVPVCYYLPICGLAVCDQAYSGAAGWCEVFGGGTDLFGIVDQGVIDAGVGILALALHLVAIG